MKKIVSLLFSMVLVVNLLAPAQAMDSRVKVVSSVAAYGTVGGALLGLASLPFGAKGRSVAVGASLGLYAGLLFGGFIVLSHHAKKEGWGQRKGDAIYPESRGPYEGGGFLPPGVGGNSAPSESTQPLEEQQERWSLKLEMEELAEQTSWATDPVFSRKAKSVPIYLPLLQVRF